MPESLGGPAKNIADTTKFVQKILSTGIGLEEEPNYRIAYTVHEILVPESNTTAGSVQIQHRTSTPSSTRFIGLVTLHSLTPFDLVLPLTLKPTLPSSTVPVEIAYQFLPPSWGRGYASEAINAMISATARDTIFWDPYTTLYIRAIVNAENSASQRVMEKVGFGKMGEWEWTGEKIYLAGEWRVRSLIFVYAREIVRVSGDMGV